MDNINLTDGLKKILLAGVGAVALTAEKAGEILEEMVEKGEITVEQGKVLNQELKRTVKENAGKKDDGEKDLSKVVDGLSSEELAKLKELIAAAENKE
ncbi:MAG: aspartyl beta-hydroxylase [Butyrivibrio sp.]|nr:aspartyl beta-hydroxylase [Butyrivibrio sp.]